MLCLTAAVSRSCCHDFHITMDWAFKLWAVINPSSSEVAFARVIHSHTGEVYTASFQDTILSHRVNCALCHQNLSQHMCGLAHWVVTRDSKGCPIEKCGPSIKLSCKGHNTGFELSCMIWEIIQIKISSGLGIWRKCVIPESSISFFN